MWRMSQQTSSMVWKLGNFKMENQIREQLETSPLSAATLLNRINGEREKQKEYHTGIRRNNTIKWWNSFFISIIFATDLLTFLPQIRHEKSVFSNYLSVYRIQCICTTYRHQPVPQQISKSGQLITLPGSYQFTGDTEANPMQYNN